MMIVCFLLLLEHPLQFRLFSFPNKESFQKRQPGCNGAQFPALNYPVSYEDFHAIRKRSLVCDDSDDLVEQVEEGQAIGGCREWLAAAVVKGEAAQLSR